MEENNLKARKLKSLGWNRYTPALILVILILAFAVLLSNYLQANVSQINLPSLQNRMQASPTPPKTKSSPTGLKPAPSNSAGGISNTGNTLSEKEYDVVSIVDGDTIEIRDGSKDYKLRYIGVDTPETVKPNTPVQCFGKEASNFNKSLVEGKKVTLEQDVSDVDKYGRLLRYVYLIDSNGNKEMVNKILVDEGYAYAYSYPPDVKYAEIFRQSEQTAREAQKGLWKSCPARKNRM